MGQYPDGFRGPLIVHDPKPPFHYDAEFTLTLSDWYHKQMPELLGWYESKQNEAAFHGREPLPDAALINDSRHTKIKVEPNKTYLVHIVCVGNWPGHAWVLDGHEMTVVEVDGVYTEPTPTGDKMLRVAPGQRMSVLIHTKKNRSRNFAIWDTMDVNMMFIYENRPIPPGYNPNATAWLVYDEEKPLPAPPTFHELNFLDDVSFVPANKEPLLGPVDHRIILDTFSAEIDGINRFTVNNKTYIPQEVPTLYTANTVGKDFASNPKVYGQVNPFVVKHGEVVEVVINNHHNNLHPWHMHGHQFQVLQRTAVNGGYFTGHYFPNVSHTPIRRDTIMVQNHGHAVLRFRANNPGVWLLHCHVEWHVEAGLMATIIEAPETFPHSQEAPPKGHYGACAAYPDPTNGNAAGKHGLHLAGANTKISTHNNGAMYPPSAKHAPAQNINQATPSKKPHAPKPTGNKPASELPSPDSAAPSAAPEHYPVPMPQPHDKPIFVDSEDSKGPWPRPHTDKGHAQIGDGSDGPPDVADSQDIKGPWPNPHSDKSHAQAGPIEAGNSDIKGLWPHPYQNDGYVKLGDHLIHTHDTG